MILGYIAAGMLFVCLELLGLVDVFLEMFCFWVCMTELIIMRWMGMRLSFLCIYSWHLSLLLNSVLYINVKLFPLMNPKPHF